MRTGAWVPLSSGFSYAGPSPHLGKPQYALPWSGLDSTALTKQSALQSQGCIPPPTVMHHRERSNQMELNVDLVRVFGWVVSNRSVDVTRRIE